MRRIAIPWSGRALVIRDAEPSASWFSDDERAIIDSFERPKRREEWMLSRIAAKRLAIDRGICSDPRACAIENRRIGRWYVSLSHSGPYAGAAIDDKPVGIDVQVVRELRDSAAHLFLSDTEIEAMQNCTIARRLLHFWCAKEAAWKRMEGAITTLKRIPLQLEHANADGLTFDGLETVAIDELIVALTT